MRRDVREGMLRSWADSFAGEAASGVSGVAEKRLGLLYVMLPGNGGDEPRLGRRFDFQGQWSAKASGCAWIESDCARERKLRLRCDVCVMDPARAVELRRRSWLRLEKMCW